MDTILKKVQEVDANDSEAIKEVLSGFFQNLLKDKASDDNQWLKVLESTICRFPKYCLSHRTTIETYLITLLDSTNYYDVIEAAKCCHVLQQVFKVTPPQNRTTTPKLCWREQMQLLCDAAHKLSATLYSNPSDKYGSKDAAESCQPNYLKNTPLTLSLLNITAVKTQAHNKHGVLSTRLKNILIFIQAMLVEPYPVAKPIRPQTILKVIVQILTMPSGTSFDVISIKSQALRTIDALIVCLGANLLPFSPLIVKLVMATLKWSSNKSIENRGKVRCVTYNTLKLWLTVLRVHKVVGRVQWDDELIAHILNDITPAVNIVQLQINNRSTKKLSKKAKRKMTTTMLEESSLASHKPSDMSKGQSYDILNEEVAKGALECGETFLTVCGVFLKPKMHKLIQEHVVRECYTIEKYSEEVGLGLLRLLEATRRAPPPDLPPPTQYCLHLYSTLQNGGSPKISKFCSEALLNIRLHLHCSTTSINFALELSPQLTNDKNKDRSINGVLEDEQNIETINDITEYEISNNSNFKSKENSNEELNSDEIQDKLTQVSPKSIEVNGDANEVNIEKDICEPLTKKMRFENDVADNVSISSNSDKSMEFLINNQEIECRDNMQEALKSGEDDYTENSLKENLSIEIESKRKSIENEVNEVLKINVAGEAEILKEQAINEYPTQLPHTKNIEKTHDALTQLPVITSNFETTDYEASQKSLEVVYDFPSTGQKVTVSIEKLDEPLPSSGDIDDVQISCGQVTVEDMLNDFVDEVVDDY